MTGRCLDYGYEAVDRWAKLPAGWTWTEVAAVATDGEDRVYVFNRGAHPVMVFSPAFCLSKPFKSREVVSPICPSAPAWDAEGLL